MGEVRKNLTMPVVILANGEDPTHSLPLSILGNAGTLLCTDGAANIALRLGQTPHIIIGDIDSLSKNSLPKSVNLIKVSTQNSTDLEKALNWCVARNTDSATLLGLSGKREDHTLANFAIMADYQKKLKLTAVTDYHTVQAISSEEEFYCVPGSVVSLIAVGGQPILNTKGLRFPLQNRPLQSGGQGISNSSESQRFSIKVSGGVVLVFIGHND